MSRCRLLAVIFPLALLAAPGRINAEVVTNQQVPFSGIFSNECPPFLPFTGGGNIHILLHTTSDSNGFHWDLSSNLDDFSAVDTAGTKYQAHVNGQTNGVCVPGTDGCFKANGSSTSPQVEITVDVYAAQESQGPTPNEQVHLKFHVTFNANGILTANIFDLETICRG